jgi:hypothetical protein
MVSAVEVRAASYHADVYHLGGTLTVQRVFSRAWHLRAGGWILTVTTAIYDGPLAIRINRPSLDGLPVEPGMPASIERDALRIGTLQVSLDGARTWSPRRPENAPPLSCSALQRDVLALTPSPPGPLSRNAGEGELQDSFTRRGIYLPSPAGGRGIGGEGIEALLDALLNIDEPAIQAPVLGLLGLGPGLTPAGDDLLCGLLVGLQVFGLRAPRLSEWASACAAMVAGVTERAAPERTTALSRTLLHYAARSVAIDPLLDVVCTLGYGDPANRGDTQTTSQATPRGYPARGGTQATPRGYPARGGTQATPRGYPARGGTQAGSARGGTQAGSARGVPGLDQLRAIGHSSGSDMLAGALLAARAVLEQEKLVGSTLVYPA